MGVERLSRSEEVRERLTREQLKRIEKLYNDVYEDVKKELRKKNVKSRRALQDVKRQIENNIVLVNEEIETGLRKDMYTMVETVTQEKKEKLRDRGYKESDLETAFVHVPDRVVKAIASGSVYNEGWTLSDAIWGYSKDVQGNLSEIIAKGVASGKDTYEIAKMLEKYVKPDQKKRSRIIEFQKYKRDSQGRILRDEKGNPIPDGKPKQFYFGNVDYNAQRLARTLIAHAYQQSFETVNKDDPFVLEYIWHSSGQHGRTCAICLDRDGQHFKKDELPLDHPNGMCTFEAYIPFSSEQVAKMINKWYDSEKGTYPELDRYAESFRR